MHKTTRTPAERARLERAHDRSQRLRWRDHYGPELAPFPPLSRFQRARQLWSRILIPATFAKAKW